MVELRDEVVEHLLVHVAHPVLFLRVLSYLGNPRPARGHVVAPDALGTVGVEFLQTVIVQDEAVCPRPLVFAVMVVDVGQAGGDTFY